MMITKTHKKETPKKAEAPAQSAIFKTLHNLSVYVTDVQDELLPDGTHGDQIAMLTEKGAERVVEALQAAGWKLTHD